MESIQPEQPLSVVATPLLQVVELPWLPLTEQLMMKEDCDSWLLEGTQLSAFKLALQLLELTVGVDSPWRVVSEAESVISINFPRA